MNPADRARRDAPSSARLRLRPWPGAARIGVVLPTDHQTVPTVHDVAEVVADARRRGLVALRTGALFPRTASVFFDAGFTTIDTLALLDARLIDVRVDAAPRTGPSHGAVRVRPMRRWHHEAAARIDRRAFGDTWGNDAATLREICSATPTHHARRAELDGTTIGFVISGAAGRSGYLQRLAVDPDHQRAGVARALVSDAITWMRGRALDDVVVNTGVENHAALALYERLGFRRRDEQLVIAELALARVPEVPHGDDVVELDR